MIILKKNIFLFFLVLVVVIFFYLSLNSMKNSSDSFDDFLYQFQNTKSYYVGKSIEKSEKLDNTIYGLLFFLKDIKDNQIPRNEYKSNYEKIYNIKFKKYLDLTLIHWGYRSLDFISAKYLLEEMNILIKKNTIWSPFVSEIAIIANLRLGVYKEALRLSNILVKNNKIPPYLRQRALYYIDYLIMIQGID